MASSATQLKQAGAVLSEICASVEDIIGAFEREMQDFLFDPFNKLYTEMGDALSEFINTDLTQAWELLPEQKAIGQFTLRQISRVV